MSWEVSLGPNGFSLFAGSQRPGSCNQGNQSRERGRKDITEQKAMWQHKEGLGKCKLKKVCIWLWNSKKNNF